MNHYGHLYFQLNSQIIEEDVIPISHHSKNANRY